MPKILRPMLASNEIVTDFDSVSYPVIASPKLDGWRSFNFEGQPRTRSGKTIPNVHTRRILTRPELEGLDGELICGSPTDPNAMQRAQSAFSTSTGEPDFTWYIFDDWHRGTDGYWEHWKAVMSAAHTLPSFCTLVPQQLVSTSEELSSFSSHVIDIGYEGAIIRAPNSPYKHNRSTFKQGWMLKVKPYVYEEGIIVCLNEKMHNANEAQQSELGYTKRSSAKTGKIPAGLLGSFTIRDRSGKSFNIGTGPLDDYDKKLMWDRREMFPGRVITFKHFKQSGVRNKPRHGQYVSFRAQEDIS